MPTKIEVRASELKRALECEQYLHNLLDGIPQEFSEYTKRAFQDGLIHESSIIQEALEKHNLKLIATQKENAIELKGVTITTTADAVAEDEYGNRVIIEAKFIRSRAIYNILNGEKTYYEQVQAYIVSEQASKGLLAMRDKDTPVNRLYQSFYVWYEPDTKVIVEAAEKIRKAARKRKPQKNHNSWLCSPIYCGYFYRCGQQKKDEFNSAELAELVDLYKSLTEEHAPFENERRKLSENIKKIMLDAGIEEFSTENAAARLVRTYRRELPKELLKELEDKMILREIIKLEVK